MFQRTAVDELYGSLRSANACLRKVHTSVTKDSPVPVEHHVVNRIADTVDELIGWFAEATDAALEVKQPVNDMPVDRRGRELLEQCQQSAARGIRGYFRRLAAFENIVELLQVGYERGPIWHAWAKGVVRNIRACEEPLLEINGALFRCALGVARAPTAEASTVQTTSTIQDQEGT